MNIKGAFGVGMSCWLLGCGVDAEEQGGTDELCPSCTPVSGGETSDFGGGQENCEEQELPLSAAVRNELGVDDIVVALSDPFSASLRFQLEDEERPDTTLTATAILGTPEYWQIGVEPSDACRDIVRIPVTLNVAASDGAFTADAVGALRIRRGDLVWQLLASADLAQASGNLELDLDESRPHLGALSFDIQGFPTGPRGNVSARVYYPGDDAPTDRIPDEDESPSSTWVYMAVGSFPADRCSAISFPIGKDEPHDWLSGSTAREVYDAARAGLPTIASARWLDGSTTDISVVMDELSASSEACLGATFGNAGLIIDSSAQLHSADDRVNAEIIGSQLALSGSTGIPKTLHLSRTLHSLTLSEAASEAGIDGLEADGTDRVRVSFELEYSFLDEAASGGGIIDVVDDASGGRVDCVAWPEASFYQEQRCVPRP